MNSVGCSTFKSQPFRIMKIFLLGLLAAGLASAQSSTESFNVVWDSPSKDSSGSMPLGNGDIGLNVWVEECGDLVFYIGKTDAWSETVRLLKIGRVRVQALAEPVYCRRALPADARSRQGRNRHHGRQA